MGYHLESLTNDSFFSVHHCYIIGYWYDVVDIHSKYHETITFDNMLDVYTVICVTLMKSVGFKKLV